MPICSVMLLVFTFMSLSYTLFFTILSLVHITIITYIRLTFVWAVTRKAQMHGASGCALLEGVRLRQPQLCRSRIFCLFRILQYDLTSRNCTASLHGLSPCRSDAGWGSASPLLASRCAVPPQHPEKIPPEFPPDPCFRAKSFPHAVKSPACYTRSGLIKFGRGGRIRTDDLRVMSTCLQYRDVSSLPSVKP